MRFIMFSSLCSAIFDMKFPSFICKTLIHRRYYKMKTEIYKLRCLPYLGTKFIPKVGRREGEGRATKGEGKGVSEGEGE